MFVHVCIRARVCVCMRAHVCVCGGGERERRERGGEGKDVGRGWWEGDGGGGEGGRGCKMSWMGTRLGIVDYYHSNTIPVWE